MEPEIAKSREARAATWAAVHPAISDELDGDSYRLLRETRQLKYDTAMYPLRQTLAELLNMDCALEELHLTYKVA